MKLKYNIDEIQESLNLLKKVNEKMEGLKEIEDLNNQNSHYFNNLNEDLSDMIEDKEELIERIEQTQGILESILTTGELDVDIMKMIMKK